jgi:WD40 repeat protein
MGNSKSKTTKNAILERRIQIQHVLNVFFPNALAELISSYDYYLKGVDSTLTSHTNMIQCGQVMSHGQQLKFVSGSHDTTLKLWDLETGKCENTFTRNTPSHRFVLNGGIIQGKMIECLALFDDGLGLKVICGSWDGVLILRDLTGASKHERIFSYPYSRMLYIIL